MTSTTIYKPQYEKSWALVIGINRYQNAPQLGYARQDAEGFASALIKNLDFPSANVTMLLDEDATRERILSSYLDYVQAHVSHDDRIAVFFAGHGYTQAGRRGEIGYLVPVDGDPSRLSTLIRWDDLTRNSELIPAKHMLFLMDACYGGLAITRTVPPGTGRFLKDMLQRYSRQVLTAGKADETVADSGGPRPGHSIFTGHLLDALDGRAATAEGIVSANSVMAYVYDRVSTDHHSRQTPHFGFFDGDGDFILAAPDLGAVAKDDEVGNDVLIQIPSSLATPSGASERELFIRTIKQLLSEPQRQIELDDLIAGELRAAMRAVSEDHFPLETQTVTPGEFAERLKHYELAVARLQTLVILLSKWANASQQHLLSRLTVRFVETASAFRGGKTVWLGLRWYPVMILMYSGGISALSANNYASLATLLMTKIPRQPTRDKSEEVIVATVDAILDVERTNIFKRLPGHERNFAPRNEYLFTELQPELDDLLFLGATYEDLFDRFEVFWALVYAALMRVETNHVWGPPGRFGWKGLRGQTDPYGALIEEANRQGASWLPLTVGLFGGSLEHFNDIATAYREKLLKSLPWF
jgi:hypothetical protein